jgi:hypothetical protein
VPESRISPATPRKLAAERYSPPIAEAFHQGRTVRDAT